MSAPTLLVDADLLVYRNTVAVEREIRWDEQNHILFSNERDAWAGIMREIENLEERFVPEKWVFAASSSGPTFRHALDPGYKSARKNARKPLAYGAVMEELKKAFHVVTFPGLEADDVLGILATKRSDIDYVICSIDKDMKTVPCTLFNGTEVRKIDRAEADYWHLYQTLVGDSTDGYPGCPGVGPVKAESILSNAGASLDAIENPGGWQWERVVASFNKRGLTEADALKQARLARILRASDWDFEKKEPILWTPAST